MGHVLLYGLYGNDDVMKCSALMRFIYSFHMPLFIFLSGMVFTPTLLTFANVGLWFRRLIIPALAIGIPYAYITGDDIMRYFTHAYKLGYWYLYVLFSLYIICSCISFKKKKTIIFGYHLTFVLWLFIFRHVYVISDNLRDIFCIDMICNLFPFFLVGNLCKKFNWYNWLFSGESLIVNATIWVLSGKIESGLSLLNESFCTGDMYIVTHILQIMVMLIGCLMTFSHVICVICVAKQLTNSKIQNLLIYIGRNTLYIYVFHYFFIRILENNVMRDWMISNSNVVCDFVISIFPTIIVVGFSLMVTEMAKKNQFIMKYIFNK